ncbi:MAG: bifunctional hydroxymethylpyrimidine kinase/phosphomethylpyrimidine kinase, partial [Rikenellaceae bacterium]|nr:bifunctional hydroxymethylpyrimidine kinase/phosphomethylpyrimidine kinase [Rikenellaceae bacterium]
MKHYARFLTIAGSDSGGGAGIQADIKTASALGCYAASAITSVTTQNTLGVSAVHVLPVEVVAGQVEAVLSDIGADAVKLGMVPTPEIAEAVAVLLKKYHVRNVVLDPVMVATSGDRLISESAVGAIVEKLFPLATLITPNVPELAFLAGRKIAGSADFRPAVEALRGRGAHAVLAKAGHLPDDEVSDRLFEGSSEHAYPYLKVHTENTHGTGCTLSSAIAAFLARGFSLPEAVGRAEDYIHGAIA